MSGQLPIRLGCCKIMNQALNERIRQLIQTKLDFELPETDTEDLHLDSMKLLELVVGLENEFGLELPEAELENLGHFQNLEAITRFVETWLDGDDQ